MTSSTWNIVQVFGGLDGKLARMGPLPRTIGMMKVIFWIPQGSPEELSKLAKSQAAMDKRRSVQKASSDDDRAELEKGLTGIRAAWKVLNNTML